MIDDIKGAPAGSAGGSKKKAKIAPKTDAPEPVSTASLASTTGAPFVPPEEVAATDEFVEEALAPDTPEPKPPKKRRFALRLPQLTRKQWLIGLAGFLVFAGGGTYYGLRVLRQPKPAPVVKQEEPKPQEPVKPATEPSKLTGLEVSPELNKLPITAVMIENSPDARPQAGLRDAGVVYELLVEGGISRFMAVFLDGQPAKIGPVRSARPPYLDFLGPWDAGYAHAGGSGQALSEIRAGGIKDLDHGPNGGSFQRSAQRFAPHNLYTSFQQMVDLQNSKGYTSNPKSLARKQEAPSTAPTARSIDAAISSSLYNSHWDYAPETNSYVRSMAGKPHTDENDGAVVNSKVIVMPVMPHRYEGIYSFYGTSGSGKVFIFQDGIVQEGLWHKGDRSAQFTFTDAAGAPIALNPGQAWFTILAAADEVAFRP